MRLIDADALKDYIRGACEDMKHLYKDNGAWAKEITESFCKDIDEQPTVSAEPHWIPVTEEPKESGKYLVTAVISFIPDHVGDPDTYEAVTTANYLADTRDPIKWWGNNVEKVLAWMPLPEAFKGVTE